MGKADLVFIPCRAVGHLVSVMEVAKLIVDRDERLSITVLIIRLPSDDKVVRYTQSLAESNLNERIKLIDLTGDVRDQELDPKSLLTTFMENMKPHVREAVNNVKTKSQLAGLVLDGFCAPMMDVADEFGVPSYICYTCSAAFLRFQLHLQTIHDEENVLTTELNEDSDTEFSVPSLVHPFPARCLPSVMFVEEWATMLLDQARKFRRCKGIIINSFAELESHAVNSFSDGKTPPVYPVGPALNIKGENYDLGPGGAHKKDEILSWLNGQPESSVVFLCFGSMGCFDEDQVKEIACALEQSGQRFLWSLREPPPKGKFGMQKEYTEWTDVLPEGFLNRTADIGKVIGWAPQVSVLAHRSIGGFVSHCGWNSTLESLWFGVPIAAWPLYAEQQFNAFELVRELGLAVEIKMDYRKDFMTKNPTIVSAEVIERGIRGVMQLDSEMRKRVQEMSEKSRKALKDGGSSFCSIGQFIDDVINNIS